MQSLDNNTQAFLALVRAGLWEKEVQLSLFENIDCLRIYQLAQEQALHGLALAGIDHSDVKPPKELLLQWIGEVQQIEHRNVAMNHFIGEHADKMMKVGINTLLVKGQGIAQCYDRPLWRTCGDIDLLLDEENYHKAVTYFNAVASTVGNEVKERLHYDCQVGLWTVELHGTLHGGLFQAMDDCLDDVQSEMFEKQLFRTWKNGGTDIFLPAPNADVIFVFTHILQHFSQGGIGLRQICDLCRLLWTYRKELDGSLLEARLKRMKLVRVWKTFGALMHNYLGLPLEAIPLYDDRKVFVDKADKVMKFVLKTGNFGHNIDTSYAHRYPFLLRKIRSFFRETGDIIEQTLIFPGYGVKVWGRMVVNGARSVMRLG